jgi:hypothetical protein
VETSSYGPHTPERLSQACRSGLVARLIGELRLRPEQAAAKVVAWESETAQDSRPREGAYWDAAWREIAESR